MEYTREQILDYSEGFPDKYQAFTDDFGISHYYNRNWWEKFILKLGSVEIICCDNFSNDSGNEIYTKSVQMYNASEEPFNVIASDDMTFTRIIARKK